MDVCKLILRPCLVDHYARAFDISVENVLETFPNSFKVSSSRREPCPEECRDSSEDNGQTYYCDCYCRHRGSGRQLRLSFISLNNSVAEVWAHFNVQVQGRAIAWSVIEQCDSRRRSTSPPT